MRDLKKIRHCDIIPSYLPKWVFLEQTKMVFGETKTISQWKRHFRRNGIAPIGHKFTQNPKPETLSNLATPVLDLDQNRKRLFIKDLIPCWGTPKRPNTFRFCFT